MSDAEDKPVREIRINPIIPAESVLVATARSMRPRKQEDKLPEAQNQRHSRQPLICDRHVPRSVPYDGFSIGPLR